jgi:3-oxoacyl-[acyl-carrier protein] reductase
VHVVTANLGDAESVASLASEAEKIADGGIDILVNNAGVTRDGLLVRMKDEDWEQVITVNLGSGFRLSRALLRGMMKRRWGRIVGISSIVGAIGNPGQANYAASKAGMVGFSKALAGEVANRGVTVNVVAPGFIETPMTDVLSDEQRARLLTGIPVGRLGVPADIAAAVTYLATQEASYVTGATVHVNGGMAML